MVKKKKKVDENNKPAGVCVCWGCVLQELHMENEDAASSSGSISGNR